MSAPDSLADKIVFVTGGSGTVGSGILHGFLKRGATVVTCSRNSDALSQIADKYAAFQDNLVLLEGDIGSEDSARKLLDIVKSRFGRIDHFVSCVGAWWQGGPLTKQSLAEFNKQLHNLAGAHFVAASVFATEMAEQKNSSYTIITGTAGERCFSPENSLVTVGASALIGISLALRAEFKPKPLRMNEFRIGLMVLPKDAVEKKWQVSHKDVGAIVAGLAADVNVKDTVVRLTSTSEFEHLMGQYVAAPSN